MQKFLTIIIGIIFIAIAVFMYYKNEYLIKNCTVETEAIVIDMKEELSTDTDSVTTYMYYPIIKYNARGETITETISSGSSNPKYNINEKITILYNPNNIKEFIVKGEKTSTIFSIVFAIFGLLVTGYGIKKILSKN